MHIFEPLVKDSTASNFSGTGAVITQGAATGYQSMAAVGAVGDTFGYMIRKEGSAQWEEGVATKTSTGFTRTPLKGSSGATTLVNFAAGQYDVMLTPTSTLAQRYHRGTSLQVVYASSYLLSDADLSFGSTTFGIDQSVPMQALLDLATTKPLMIVWDVACGVTSVSTTEAARVRSNTYVKALPGCGAIQRTNQPTPMFRNYNPTVSTTAPWGIDKNIVFEGGIWSGNRANQSVKETAANGGIFLMDFIGVDGLAMLGGIEFRNAKAFAWHATNVQHVMLNKYRVDFGAGNTDLNTDGIHFNGPARYVTSRDAELLNCADDAFALNCDDGWGAGGQYGPYGHVYGDITDVEIDGTFLQGSICGFRGLSGGSRLDRISIKNTKGKTSAYGMVVDNFTPSLTELTGPGNVGMIEVDGWNVEVVAPPSGDWVRADIHISCKVEQLIIRNATKGKFQNTKFPFLLLEASADIGQLVIGNYNSYPFNGGTYLTDQITFVAGAKVRSMKVQGSSFDAPGATGGYPITIPAGVTIQQLTMSGNTGIGFTDFVSNAGTITNLNLATNSNFMAGAPADTTAPTATAANVTNAAPTVVAITASEALDGSYVPAASAFSVTGHTVSSVAVSGATINLTVSAAFTNGEAARTVTYTQPATNGARDVAGNLMATFPTALAVTNSVGSATNTWTLDTGFVEVSSSAVNFSGSIAAVEVARKTAVDAFNANVQASTTVRFTGNAATALHAGVLLRGINLQPYNGSSRAAYVFDIDKVAGTVGISLQNGSSTTPIGSAVTVSGGIVLNTDYNVTFTAKATALSARIQRVSDSLYLQPGGTWAATAVNCCAGTDTGLGAGSGLQYGLYSYAYNSDNSVSGVTYNSFTATAAP